MTRIGVLALQGDVEEHIYALMKASKTSNLNVEVVEVKKPSQLDSIDGLVIPGGESTTIRYLASYIGLTPKLKAKIEEGIPTLATCAGLILLAKKARDAVLKEPEQSLLGVLNVEVLRNAFGRQKDSFETKLLVEGFGEVKAVFIRAPIVTEVWNPAKPISKLNHPKLGEVIVAVKQENIIGLAFHPELTTTAFHEWLINEAIK